MRSVLLVAFDGDYAPERYPTGTIKSRHSRLSPWRSVAGRCAEVDAVNEQRRVKALQVGRLFEQILAREIISAFPQDFRHGLCPGIAGRGQEDVSRFPGRPFFHELQELVHARVVGPDRIVWDLLP
jgi:hypothetical protein